jgi:hypothetical protein
MSEISLGKPSSQRNTQQAAAKKKKREPLGHMPTLLLNEKNEPDKQIMSPASNKGQSTELRSCK